MLQRTASIQDEKRLTTDMGGDFLEKEGFYDTLLGRIKVLIAEVSVATREGHIVAKERGEFMAVAY